MLLVLEVLTAWINLYLLRSAAVFERAIWIIGVPMYTWVLDGLVRPPEVVRCPPG